MKINRRHTFTHNGVNRKVGIQVAKRKSKAGPSGQEMLLQHIGQCADKIDRAATEIGAVVDRLESAEKTIEIAALGLTLQELLHTLDRSYAQLNAALQSARRNDEGSA